MYIAKPRNGCKNHTANFAKVEFQEVRIVQVGLLLSILRVTKGHRGNLSNISKDAFRPDLITVLRKHQF